MKASLLITSALLTAGTLTSQASLIITAVFDGPLTGGVPKGIELYATADIADLSIYGVGSANNGGGTDGEEFTFPGDSITVGTFIYVASDTTGFTDFFGFAPTYNAGSAMSVNGDDAIEVFQNGSVIDVFGEISGSASSGGWAYTDGWAYRNNGTGPDGTTFTLANWSFSGTDALDLETTNDTAANPVPVGTYNPVPEPSMALLGGLGLLGLLRRRR